VGGHRGRRPLPRRPKLAGDFRRIAERRGKNKATVAVARKIFTLVYYGRRDGQIRCLAPADREAA